MSKKKPAIKKTKKRAARRPPARSALFLSPGQGRSYDMGRMTAIFKADEKETANAYSVSEWWLEPDTTGPGIHSHQEDDLFYVLEGMMSFWLGDHWVDAPRGSFILVPGGMKHDFCNRSGARAGALNFSSPGGFEENMASIVEWFKKYPPGPVSRSL